MTVLGESYSKQRTPLGYYFGAIFSVDRNKVPGDEKHFLSEDTHCLIMYTFFIHFLIRSLEFVLLSDYVILLCHLLV